MKLKNPVKEVILTFWITSAIVLQRKLMLT